jgi:hypothetical protein
VGFGYALGSGTEETLCHIDGGTQPHDARFSITELHDARFSIVARQLAAYFVFTVSNGLVPELRLSVLSCYEWWRVLQCFTSKTQHSYALRTNPSTQIQQPPFAAQLFQTLSVLHMR